MGLRSYLIIEGDNKKKWHLPYLKLREWILVHPPRLSVHPPRLSAHPLRLLVHPPRLLVHPPPIRLNEMIVQGRYSLKITPEHRSPEMTPWLVLT